MAAYPLQVTSIMAYHTLATHLCFAPIVDF